MTGRSDAACHSCGVHWPISVSWTPRDDAELTAGWRLWLELSDRVWPGPTWSGTPADAIRQLRDLLGTCNEIQAEYLASSAKGSGDIVRLLQSMFFAAWLPVELWASDEAPLDEERAALLHADLAGFAEHAEGILTVLARGGGWTELDAAHRGD